MLYKINFNFIFILEYFFKRQIFINKFGFYSILPNDIYDHYEGNINTCKLKKVADLEIYLRSISVFSKGKGGSSDITIQDLVSHLKTSYPILNEHKFVVSLNKNYVFDLDEDLQNNDELALIPAISGG